jgi:RNA-directed DNA polymerase
MKNRKAAGNNPTENWAQLPWRKLELHVYRIQKRIFKAQCRGNTRAVHKLQKLLMKSSAARLVAVRRVSQDNQGKQTAGIDGVKALTPVQRFAMVQALHPKQTNRHQPRPVRRIYIPKRTTGEMRPLGIPTMFDRAYQALAKLALEPQWEARFEPNSYGFRPGRGAHDAIEAIHTMISLKSKYVLDADIKGCFDHINHQALLAKVQTYPAMRRMIKAWLKAGVLSGGEVFPTEAGTPQGGVISPLLANIALHGMEEALRRLCPQKEGRLLMVRYADDFVVFHPSEQAITKAQAFLHTWLAQIGLELKPSKTRVTHTLYPYQGNVGFDFLGFTIRQYPVGKTQTGKTPQGKPLGFKTTITPSTEAIKRHLQATGQIIRAAKAWSQEALIGQLNPVILGWTRYYRTVVAGASFAKCDHLLFQQVLRWSKRRHPHKSVFWKVNKYWTVNQGKGWRFQTPTGQRLRKHSETHIRRHIKVQGTASPYDGNLLYWSQRLRAHPLLRSTLARLLQKQQGRCSYCGRYFIEEDQIEIDHFLPLSQGGKARFDNLMALHRYCHDQRHAKKQKVSNDKDGRTEEPDDAKGSRPVLETSRFREEMA